MQLNNGKKGTYTHQMGSGYGNCTISRKDAHYQQRIERSRKHKNRYQVAVVQVQEEVQQPIESERERGKGGRPPFHHQRQHQTQISLAAVAPLRASIVRWHPSQAASPRFSSIILQYQISTAPDQVRQQ